jgi:hypothetical protein
VSDTPANPDTPQNPPPDARGRRGRGKGTTGRAGAKDVAAAHVAAGRTLKDTAAAANVSERTVQRWTAGDAAFQARVAELRSAMVAEAAGRLASGMGAAAVTLLLLLKSKDEDVRHKAAVKVIELGLKVRDQTEIEERLARVEEQLTGGKTDGGDARAGEEAGDAGPGPDRPG